MTSKLPTFGKLDLIIEGSSTSSLKEDTPKFDKHRPSQLEAFPQITGETSIANTPDHSPHIGNRLLLKKENQVVPAEKKKMVKRPFELAPLDFGQGNDSAKNIFFRCEESNDGDEPYFPGIYYINGDFWEKYQKKNKLGEGTSAIVRKCIRREDGMPFAVKIVRTRDEEITHQVKPSVPRAPKGALGPIFPPFQFF